jgi:HsdM-like protein
MERMPKAKQSSTAPTNDGAIVGYETRLWQMADALRGSMDAAEYKHVVLGLIFLKYISDAFEAQHAQLEAEQAQGARPGGPGRVSCAQHLLGTTGGALGAPEGPGQAVYHRRARGRRNDRDRARQRLAEGRAA